METILITSKNKEQAFEVYGPNVRFLTPPEAGSGAPSVLYGTIPAGVSIPLHSHADEENFYVLAGSAQVLKVEGEKMDWITVTTGDFVHIPGNVKHAWRNTSGAAFEALIISTQTIYRFFHEFARRPIADGETLPPPTPEELSHAQKVFDHFHYWTGSPEENQEIGVSLIG